MLRLFRWLLILASLFNFTPHRSPIEGIRYWVSEWGEHRSVCKYLVTNLNGLLIREGKCYSSLHKGAQEPQCRGSSAAGPWMTRNDTRPRWSLLSSLSVSAGTRRWPRWHRCCGLHGGAAPCSADTGLSQSGALRGCSHPITSSHTIIYHYQAVSPTASVTLKRMSLDFYTPSPVCVMSVPQRREWSVGEGWGDK